MSQPQNVDQYEDMMNSHFMNINSHPKNMCILCRIVAEGNYEFVERYFKLRERPECHDNTTPVHLAVINGRLGMLRVLKDNGFDMNTLDKIHGVTPLHLAIQNDRYIIVEDLLSYGADPNMPSNCGTPLEYARKIGAQLCLPLLQGGFAPLKPPWGICPRGFAPLTPLGICPH